MKNLVTDHYEALWPCGERSSSAQALAPRVSSLAGKKVALLWDYMFNGDVVFEELSLALKEQFPGVEFVHWDEFGNTHGQNEKQIIAGLGARLRGLGVDAALSGMGC